MSASSSYSRYDLFRHADNDGLTFPDGRPVENSVVAMYIKYDSCLSLVASIDPSLRDRACSYDLMIELNLSKMSSNELSIYCFMSLVNQSTSVSFYVFSDFSNCSQSSCASARGDLRP